MDQARHAFVDHTSEVELHLHAPSLAGALRRGGHALAELMLGDGPRGAETIRDEVRVTAPDRAALLAAWIDELVFRAETRKAVFTGFVVTVGDGELTAEIGGIAEPVIKTAVKAATFHGLRVVEEEGRWVATVVLDV
jgi:SHS2 domain-containing protein